MRIVVVDASRVGCARFLFLLNDITDARIVGITSDAFKVLDTLQALRPDLLILDIEMPGKSGLTLLKEVRESDPSLTIMILTNASSPQYQKRCKELGADYFFDKSREFKNAAEILRQLATDPEQAMRAVR